MLGGIILMSFLLFMYGMLFYELHLEMQEVAQMSNEEKDCLYNHCLGNIAKWNEANK